MPYSVNTVASASSELRTVPAVLPLSVFQPSFDTQSCWVPQAERPVWRPDPLASPNKLPWLGWQVGLGALLPQGSGAGSAAAPF